METDIDIPAVVSYITDIKAVPDGELVLIGGNQFDKTLIQYVSEDEGETWQKECEYLSKLPLDMSDAEAVDGYGWISDDELPLTQEDIGIDTTGLIQADSVRDECVTIYGTVKDCYQHYYDQYGEIASSLTYNIASCRFGWVKDKLLENYMTTDYYCEDAVLVDISEKEAALWETQQVYALKDESEETSRLVIYEDVVLFIEAEAAFTDEVIKHIRTKLADCLE